MRLPGLSTASGLRKAPGLRKALWCVVASAALVLAALATTSGPAGAAQVASTASSSARPCDIYAIGGTPCVAAYSTVRALYRGYRGPLYRVTRVSDGTSTDIGVLPGGYANAAAQDAFCAGTVCTITRLYDQSPERNDLGIEPIGGNGSAGRRARSPTRCRSSSAATTSTACPSRPASATATT